MMMVSMGFKQVDQQLQAEIAFTHAAVRRTMQRHERLRICKDLPLQRRNLATVLTYGDLLALAQQQSLCTD